MLVMSIRAVGFDIDGTLYPECYIRFRSVPFVISNLKSVYAFYKARKAMRRYSSDPQIIRNPSRAEISYLAVQLRCPVGEASVIRDEVIYQGWEKYFKDLPICPGVRECLMQFRQAGLKIAALSDFPVGNKLQYLGLEDLFDVSLGFPESGNLKPAPQPFINMAERLDIKPSEIIYIGNRVDYDVVGANSVGMKGALILNAEEKNGIPPEITVYKSYQQIAQCILAEVRR